MIITEVVPQSGAASSELPKASTGYGKKANTTLKRGLLVLGIDDIAQFRKDREIVARVVQPVVSHRTP